MTTCSGCRQPLEPLAQIRTYHTSCDPQGRVEMLLEHLAGLLSILEDTLPHIRKTSCFDVGDIEAVMEASWAALEYKPAQMKERE